MSRQRFAVCGLMTVETCVRVERFPVEYDPISFPFHSVTQSVSGVGLNVAAGLSALGHEVRLVLLVGVDDAAMLCAPRARPPRVRGRMAPNPAWDLHEPDRGAGGYAGPALHLLRLEGPPAASPGDGPLSGYRGTCARCRRGQHQPRPADASGLARGRRAGGHRCPRPARLRGRLQLRLHPSGFRDRP